MFGLIYHVPHADLSVLPRNGAWLHPGYQDPPAHGADHEAEVGAGHKLDPVIYLKS